MQTRGAVCIRSSPIKTFGRGKINCCLSLRLQVSCHCEPVRTLVWQSPGSMEPGNDYHQKSRKIPLFRELFGTFSSQQGDCHGQCAHWSRNDSFIFQTTIYRTSLCFRVEFPAVQGQGTFRTVGIPGGAAVPAEEDDPVAEIAAFLRREDGAQLLLHLLRLLALG